MNRVTRFLEILLWTFLVYSVRTVSCQLKVQGFIGEDVLLPCVYNEDDPLPQTVSVYWTDKDDRVVLDIKNNAADVSKQDQRFRGRVQSFQNLYGKGNFSIVLQNLQQLDESPYECHIPSVDFQRRVSLSVSGKRVEEVQPTETSGRSGGAAVTPNSLHVVLLSLLCSLDVLFMLTCELKGIVLRI